MSDRSMAEALASTRAGAGDRTVSGANDLDRKALALESPSVSSFIRDGVGRPRSDGGDHRPSHRSTGASTAQLNTRIPTELHSRARRAVFELDTSNAEPRTLQELVAKALDAELCRLGF